MTCQHYLGGLYARTIDWPHYSNQTEVNDTVQIKENRAQPIVHTDNDKPCCELNETVQVYEHSLVEFMYNQN